MIEIEVGNKRYKVLVAKSELDREKGLSGRDSLPEGEGMLFVLPSTQPVSFWMKDTKFDLDMVFINEDFEVTKVVHAKAMDETPISESDVRYVLEVNPDSGINIGDELLIASDLKMFKMDVLDKDGNSLMQLQGGERVFSRKNTRVLILLALRAHRTNSDKDYKALGRTVFKYLKIQDTNKPQYVDEPKAKK